MRSVGSNALRCVRHERVRQTLAHNFINEGFRAEDFRVNHNGQTFLIAQGAHEVDKIGILHFFADQRIAQHTAVNAHGSVQGVEAGGDLHALGIVHRFAVGQINACFFQCRTAVGERILNHEILRALGVDKRSDKGVFGCDNGRHVGNAVSGKAFFYAFGRTRRDFVNHAPGEGNFRRIGQIVRKALRRKAVFHPCLGNRADTAGQFFTVVAAVVHRHHGNGRCTCFIASEQQSGHHAHGVACFCRAVCHIFLDNRQKCAVGAVKGIAFFRDGEADHLQAFRSENFTQTVHHGFVGAVGAQTLGYAGDNFTRGGGVRVQRHVHCQVVKGRIDFVDDIVVEGIGRNNAAVGKALVQKALLKHRNKSAENVSCAKVNPDGGFRRRIGHCLYIKLGQLDIGFFPSGAVIQAVSCHVKHR